MTHHPSTDYLGDAEQPEQPRKTRRLEPLGDRVIVKVVKDAEMTASGIVIPDSVRERSQRGIVLAVGPGRWENGERVPLGIDVGDMLLFSKFGGTELPEGLAEAEEGGQLVLREGDILAIEHWEEADGIPDAEPGADLMDAPPPGGDMYPGDLPEGSRPIPDEAD